MCKPSYLRNSAAFDRCCLSSHNKVGLQRKPCSDVPLKLLGSRLSKRQPFVHVWRKRTTTRSLTVIKSCMGAFVGLGHMDVAHYDPGPLDVLLDHSVYPNFVLGRDVFKTRASWPERPWTTARQWVTHFMLILPTGARSNLQRS